MISNSRVDIDSLAKTLYNAVKKLENSEMDVETADQMFIKAFFTVPAETQLNHSLFVSSFISFAKYRIGLLEPSMIEEYISKKFPRSAFFYAVWLSSAGNDRERFQYILNIAIRRQAEPKNLLIAMQENNNTKKITHANQPIHKTQITLPPEPPIPQFSFVLNSNENAPISAVPNPQNPITPTLMKPKVERISSSIASQSIDKRRSRNRVFNVVSVPFNEPPARVPISEIEKMDEEVDESIPTPNKTSAESIGSSQNSLNTSNNGVIYSPENEPEPIHQQLPSNKNAHMSKNVSNISVIPAKPSYRRHNSESSLTMNENEAALEKSNQSSNQFLNYEKFATTKAKPTETQTHSRSQEKMKEFLRNISKMNGDILLIFNIISDNNRIESVNKRTYIKIEEIGKGGSSRVFKVFDSSCKIYALKCVNLEGNQEILASYMNEIALLKKLNDNPMVINLIDSEIRLEEKLILIVLELGETDLSKRLTEVGGSFDTNTIRVYWQQMLHCVRTIHKERIVHTDLKPANFVLVKGQLKLIDFGIAKQINSDTTNITRDSQIGTINYMSPEAVIESAEKTGKMKLGRASDVWSLGCILHQMTFGHCPLHNLNMVGKIRELSKGTDSPLEFERVLPSGAEVHPQLLNSIGLCLVRDPRQRATIDDLLTHPFLNTYCRHCVAK